MAVPQGPHIIEDIPPLPGTVVCRTFTLHDGTIADPVILVNMNMNIIFIFVGLNKYQEHRRIPGNPACQDIRLRLAAAHWIKISIQSRASSSAR
jgi:hypothetical protein